MADNKTDFVQERVQYLSGLKNPTEQQRLFLELAAQVQNGTLSASDKSFNVLLQAEKADVKAQEAKRKARKLIADGQEKKRKARNHELYKVAGLLSVAGLVSKETGKPTMDRGELLGALLSIADVAADDPKRQAWKSKGDNQLQALEKTAD